MKTFRKISRTQLPDRNHDVVLVCDVEEDRGSRRGKALLFSSAPHVAYSMACALRLDLGGVLAFKGEETTIIWCADGVVGVDAFADDRLNNTDDMQPFLIHPLPDDDKVTGLWLSKRITAFRSDMGLNYIPGESEVDRLLAIADSGTIERDDGSAEILARDWNLAFSGSDLPRPPKRHERRSTGFDVEELVFGAWHARAAICAQYLARAERRAKVRTKNANKRDHCSRCVYACTRALGACSLTDAEVVARYPNTDDARAWMAAFTWSDARVNQGRGRSMAWGPETTVVGAPLIYAARKLTPPFKRANNLDPEQVIGAGWQAKLAEMAAKIAERPVDEQARLFWALRQLWAHGHWDWDAKFAQGRGGDDHRLSRNDVLYIRLDHGWRGFDIQVGSDTKASSWDRGGGGGWGPSSKPTPIRPDQRPRFKTEYSHPYYEHLLDWTGEPLGTQKSKLHLRIIGP